MKEKDLFEELTGWDFREQRGPVMRLRPGTVNYFFLERGHVMEYFRLEPGGQKVVALFFGPGEFVLPSHAAFSCFEPLDKGIRKPAKHGDVMQALWNYAGAGELYREIQRQYWTKVEDRIRVYWHLAPKERFDHLKATQPWVLDLAKEEDVASYLHISVVLLREFRERKNWPRHG